MQRNENSEGFQGTLHVDTVFGTKLYWLRLWLLSNVQTLCHALIFTDAERYIFVVYLWYILALNF